MDIEPDATDPVRTVARADVASTADTEAIDTLRAELASLRREVADLRAPRHAVDDARANVVAGTRRSSVVSRRRLVQSAAAAVVGGTAAALANGQSAAAGAGDPILIGRTTNTTTQPTRVDYTSTGGARSAFLFQSGSKYDTNFSLRPSALAVVTSNQPQPTGMFAYTEVDAADASGLTGWSASAQGVGVRAVNESGGTALEAGQGAVGVRTDGTAYGLEATGGRAAMHLAGSTTVSPIDRTDSHATGEIDAVTGTAATSSLWACVGGGTPGQWRVVAGPDTAGALHPIVPARVYDSRAGLPTPGRISSGQSRVVSVKDSRNPSSGTVVGADLVPAGATAVALNVTIDATQATGFLGVTPGDATSSPASTINWSAPGLILANAGIVKLDGNRQIKVFCAGAGGSTDFIIDVTGYYR